MKGGVVVVMAAYNAEKTLSPVIRGLRISLPGAFIIGINDGSLDGTGALLRSVCDRAIEFPVNRGKGTALQAGFAAAIELDCTSVLTIDSDGQHDPAFAPSIMAALDSWHIAIGTRDLTGEQMPGTAALPISSPALRLEWSPVALSTTASPDSAESGARSWMKYVRRVIGMSSRPTSLSGLLMPGSRL